MNGGTGSASGERETDNVQVTLSRAQLTGFEVAITILKLMR